MRTHSHTHTREGTKSQFQWGDEGRSCCVVRATHTSFYRCPASLLLLLGTDELVGRVPERTERERERLHQRPTGPPVSSLTILMSIGALTSALAAPNPSSLLFFSLYVRLLFDAAVAVGLFLFPRLELTRPRSLERDAKPFQSHERESKKRRETLFYVIFISPLAVPWFCWTA